MREPGIYHQWVKLSLFVCWLVGMLLRFVKMKMPFIDNANMPVIVFEEISEILRLKLKLEVSLVRSVLSLTSF